MPPANDLTSSQTTFPSDSEPYDVQHPSGSSEQPPSTVSSNRGPMILYSPPTFWSIVRGAAINVLLPFINGLMLGFGELLAHEAAFRLGWSGTKIFPTHRSSAAARRPAGPGVEIIDDPIERRRRNGRELDAYTSLE